MSGGYVEPPGGRVDIGNVRSSTPPPELQGEEREAYISQQRARPTSAKGRFRQSGERDLSPDDLRRIETQRRRNERAARGERDAAAMARYRSPQDAAARAALATSLEGEDPNLAKTIGILSDEAGAADLESLGRARDSGTLAYRSLYGGERKSRHGRKLIKRARRTMRDTNRSGDINAVDPMTLIRGAWLDAAKAQGEIEANENAVIKVGDNARRGRGGKVGKSGGRSAGTIAGETIDPSNVEEIMARREIGGRGNGWKALSSEFSRAEISAARGRIARNKPAAPVSPIEAGRAYGGGAEMAMQGEAPSIPGGQGMVRGTGRKVTGGGSGAGVMIGEEIARENDARAQAARGKRFAYQEREILARWESRRAARQFLGPHIPGIPRFAEGGWFEGLKDGGRPKYGLALDLDLGGSIHGSYLRGVFGFTGAMPRKGSAARRELEDQLKAGVRNRRKYEKKPLYQRGGKSDPEWDKARSTFLSGLTGDARCSNCGTPVIVGGKDPKTRAYVDHIVDTASGGTHDQSNLQLLCNRCNGFKGGGRSARDLSTMRSRADGGRMRGWKWGKYAEGGNVKWTGMSGSRGGVRSVTEVGERGRELIVQGHNGESEVIPTHKVESWKASFMQGRAEGGAAFPYGRGINIRGVSGTSLGARMEEGSARAVGAGLATSANVVRVAVVNFPPFLENAQNFAQGFAQAAAKANPAQGQANAGPAAGPAESSRSGQPGVNEAVASGRARGSGNPQERVEARRAAAANVLDLQEQLGNVRAGISGSLQEVPVRALSVAFGQIAQQMIGGRGEILSRARKAQRFAGEAGQEVGELERLEQERQRMIIQNRDIDRGISDLSPEDAAATRARNLERIPLFDTAIEEQRGVAQGAVDAARREEKGILTRGQQVKAQAVGLGGIIAGTATFSAAITAFSFATQAAQTALDPLVQSLMGFPRAVNEAQAAVRDAITGMRGQARAGTAAGVAPSGISAAFLDANPAIQQAATNRAAQVASQQALGLTRAGRRTGNEGLFEGTGGLFGTNILTEMFGGQSGFLQDVTKRLGAGQTQGDQALMTAAKVLPFVGPAVSAIEKLSASQNTPVTGEERIQVIADLNKNLKSAAEYAGDVSQAFSYIPDASKELRDAMIASAEATGDAGAKARAQELSRLGVAVTGPGGRALAGTQFEQFAQQAARGQLIQDPELLLRAGEPQRRAEAFAMRRQAEFQRREDLPAAFALQRLASPAPRFGSTFSTEGILGGARDPEGQKTLDNIAKYTQLSAEADLENTKYQQQGMKALESIVARIDRPTLDGGPPMIASGRGTRPPTAPGRPGQSRPGVGPALTEFRGIVSEIGEIGSQIQSIQEGINLRQTNLQVKEYNNSIRITQRSLADARDLWAAINGNASDTLGGLQGQNILLERQNQLLSRRAQRLGFRSEALGFKQSELQQQAQQMQFELQQRQINFSTAVAGFTAPGLTPEERSARINEAKIEAEYAQQQLDIQIKIAAMAREQLKIAKEQASINKAQFANSNQIADNQFAIQRIEAQRAITDLSAQLALLQEGRSVTIDTAAAEAAIARLQKRQQALIEQAQSYVEQGQQVRSQVLKDTAELMANTGKAFGQLVGNVQNAWQRAFASYYSNFYNPLVKGLENLANLSLGGQSGGGSSGARRTATGTNTRVDKPTQFIAGDAGGEQVIVLRNPQAGTLTNLGGGGGTVVNVGGVTVVLQSTGKNEDDAQMIARLVERNLSSKLAALG